MLHVEPSLDTLSLHFDNISSIKINSLSFSCESGTLEAVHLPRHTTEGPSWGYPVLVLGAVCPFLEPFCGELLSKVDRPGKKIL